MCTSSPKCCSTSVYSQWHFHPVKTSGHLCLSPVIFCSRTTWTGRSRDHAWICSSRQGMRLNNMHTFLSRTLVQTVMLNWNPAFTKMLQHNTKIWKKRVKRSCWLPHALVKEKTLLHKWSSSTEQAPTWLHQYIFSAVGFFKNYPPNIILSRFSIIPKCNIKPSCRFGEFLLLYSTLLCLLWIHIVSLICLCSRCIFNSHI